MVLLKQLTQSDEMEFRGRGSCRQSEKTSRGKGHKQVLLRCCWHVLSHSSNEIGWSFTERCWIVASRMHENGEDGDVCANKEAFLLQCSLKGHWRLSSLEN